MSLANTIDNEKVGILSSWIYPVPRWYESKRIAKNLVFLSFFLRESKFFWQWMGTGVLKMLAGPEEESKSHLAIKAMQGQMVAGMGIPCQYHPKSVPTCSYQSLMQQAQGRCPNRLVQMSSNQSGNKVERSRFQRNTKCYEPIWVMPNPLQSGLNWKCSSLSRLYHTIQKINIPSTIQKLALQSLLSLSLLKLLLCIYHFQCPMDTNPIDCGQ